MPSPAGPTGELRFLPPDLLQPLHFDDDAAPMIRSDHRAALTEEVARFQADVRRLALSAAQAIVQQELDRRRVTRPGRPAGRRAAPPRTSRAAPAPAPAAAPPPKPAPPAPSPAEPAAAPAATAAPTGKRGKWTRETIINELATWMLSGTAIDAAFVTRHGPPGLVAAARRVFGRFEAALNVAGLRVSELYPDGPPQRGQV